MKSDSANNAPTKLFVPIENLDVESVVRVGDVIIQPSSDLESVIDTFNNVTHKTKSTEEQKIKFAEWYKHDLTKNLGGRAFVEIEWQLADGRTDKVD